MQRNGAPQKKENKKRAQGKPGAHGTRGPVRHYAYGEKETPQVQTGHRLPCAMVLTAYFALSPVIGLMLPPSPSRTGYPVAKAQRPLQSARTTRLGRPRAIVTATSTGQCRSLSEDVLRRSSARRLVRLRTRPAHEPAHREQDLRARRSRVHRIPSRVCDDRETPSHGTERIASKSRMLICEVGFHALQKLRAS